MRNEKVYTQMSDDFLKATSKKVDEHVLLVIPEHVDVGYFSSILIVLGAYCIIITSVSLTWACAT